MSHQDPPFEAALDAATPGCPTELLEFDASNPRLEDGRSYSTSDDVAMIRSLKEVAALNELISSICANTYRDIEPLIVMGEPTGPLKVLEGNRRLACIKLLRDQELARKCGVGVVPNISAEVLASLEQVTVYRVENAEAARAFIGFKHINGPHRWESFAKARFVSDWYKKEREFGLTIDDIATKLGDENTTIRSMVAGMFVLDQATNDGFKIHDKFNRARFAFSHLYTALTRIEYQIFLGLEKGWATNPAPNPVPESHQGHLCEIMLWLYGSRSKKIEPLIKSQNPDLADLGTVLKHPVALQSIRGGEPLRTAMMEIRPPKALLANSLVDLQRRLREALIAASKNNLSSEEMCEAATSVKLQAESLYLLVLSKKESGPDQEDNHRHGEPGHDAD